MAVNAPLQEVPFIEHSRIPVQTSSMTGQSVESGGSSLLELCLARLSKLQPQSSDLRERHAAMIAELTERLPAADAIVQECREEHAGTLKRQYDLVRAEGRKQLGKLPSSEAAYYRAMREWEESKKQKEQRLSDLEAFMQHRKQLSSFASEADIAAVDDAVEKAKKAYRLAIDEEVRARNKFAAAGTTLEQEKTNLAALNNEVTRLRNELSGRSFFDPILGLEHNP